MSTQDPTRDELLAMAYADGELSPEERSEFEARLASEPGLARDVADYNTLQVLARQMAPPEPLDHEWRRVEAEPTQRGLRATGWVLFVAGCLGVGGMTIYSVATSTEPLWTRIVILAVLVGLLLLLLATARTRICTYPLDPYREVQR